MRWYSIRKIDSNQREFLDRRSIKLQLKKRRYNNRERRNKLNKREYAKRKGQKFKPLVLNATAPSDFRLTNNTFEVLEYFKTIIAIIRSKRNDIKIFFDLKKVEYISVDTVMYMLAILRNLKDKSYRNISFSGNSPIDKEAKRIFEESGFLNYVNGKNIKILPNSKKIQIMTGKTVDPTIPKSICQFVNKACDTDKKFTFDLYATLVELINNTTQHAYAGNSLFWVNEWYLFAEETEHEILFAFMDTGEGIPRTVDKKLREKITLISKDDSMFIRTALEGKQRTQTRKDNRGKGLPRVVDACINGNLSSMSIYSGHGSCKILKNNKELYMCDEYKDELFGTLFTWTIKKVS